MFTALLQFKFKQVQRWYRMTFHFHPKAGGFPDRQSQSSMRMESCDVTRNK
jgi:hypothetical protein